MPSRRGQRLATRPLGVIAAHAGIQDAFGLGDYESSRSDGMHSGFGRIARVHVPGKAASDR